MGSGTSAVQVHANQDSILIPGQGLTAVVSDPLDEHADFEGFFEELVNVLKAPPPGEDTKEIKILDISEKEFRVVSVRDKDKLNEKGDAAPADRVQTMIYRPLTRYDEAKAKDEQPFCFLVEEKRNDIDALVDRGVTTLHRGPPMQVEYYKQWVDFRERNSGPFAVGFLRNMLERALGVNDVEVLPDQDTLTVPVPIGWKSAITGPLSGLVDFEALWEKLLLAIRTGTGPECDRKEVDEDHEDEFMLKLYKKTDVSETKIGPVATQAAAEAAARGEDEAGARAAAEKAVAAFKEAVDRGEEASGEVEVFQVTRVRFKKDVVFAERSMAYFILECYDFFGQLTTVISMLICKETLRMEAYSFPATPRDAGDTIKGVVQFVVDAVLERVKQRPAPSASAGSSS